MYRVQLLVAEEEASGFERIFPTCWSGSRKTPELERDSVSLLCHSSDKKEVRAVRFSFVCLSPYQAGDFLKCLRRRFKEGTTRDIQILEMVAWEVSIQYF